MSKATAVILIAILTIKVHSQEPLNVDLIWQESERNLSRIFDDPAAVNEYLDSLREEHINQGYFLFSVDSILRVSSHWTAYLHKGNRYSWGSITVNDEVGAIFKRRIKRNESSIMSPSQLGEQIKYALESYANTGHPFAETQFSNINLSDSVLTFNLNVNPGPVVLIDSVIVKSDNPAGVYFLQNYLGLRTRGLYKRKRILQIESRLREVSFVSLKRPPELQFTEDGAWVFLYADRKKANSFDGVVGFQQDPADDRFIITGEVDLGLVNVLNKGERFRLNWKRLQLQTQELLLSAAYPYILNSDFGLEGKVQIFRRDTLFTSTLLSASVLYQFSANRWLRGYAQQERASGVSFNQNFSLADSDTRSYGLEGGGEWLDYRFNPSRGFAFKAGAGVGKKEFTPIVLETEGTSQSTQTVNQYEFAAAFRAFIPITERWVIHFAGNQAAKIAPEIYENEMYRIGGLKLLRGMNEASIFASSYAIATGEIRYLFEENSNLFLFFDQGWYENKSPDNFVTDTPYGFGAGVRFRTNVGIFSLNYALGSQFDNPILFRAAKVHFGFVNFF